MMNNRQEPMVLRHPFMSRLYHWCLIFGFLPAAITGAMIWLKIGGENVVNWAMRIHIMGATLFTLSTIAYALFSFDRVVHFFHTIFSWNKNDIEWLKVGGGYPQKMLLGKKIAVPPMGKINSGQKMMGLIMAFGGAFIMVSGWILYAFIPFTPKVVIYWLGFGHLWGGLFLLLCTLAHMGLGIYNWSEFKAMLGNGTVPLSVAKDHNPLWVENDLEPVAEKPSKETVSSPV